MEDFQSSTKKPRVSERPTKSRFSEPTSDDCIKMSKLKRLYSQEHAKEQCVGIEHVLRLAGGKKSEVVDLCTVKTTLVIK